MPSSKGKAKWFPAASPQQRGTLRWVWSVVRCGHYLVPLVILQVVEGASVVLYALFLQQVVDAAMGEEPTAFWLAALWLGMVVVAQLTLRAVIRWLNELCKATAENALKQHVMHNLMITDQLVVGKVHTAEWLNRLTNDAVVVANGYALILPGLAGTTTRLVCALGMIVVLDHRLALMLLPIGAVLVSVTFAFRMALKRLHKAIQEADGKLRVVLQEHLSSMLVVRSFVVEDLALSQECERMEEHKAARLRKNRYSNLCNIGYGAAMNGLYLFGVAWCGYGIMQGTMSFGTLTAILQLVSRIQAPLGSMSGYVPQYYSALASAERLNEVESLPLAQAEGPYGIMRARRFYEDELESFGLHDVSFSYAERSGIPTGPVPCVLSRVNLEVHKGEFVALTGHSGCGKSTSIKLLMGAYTPLQGKAVLVAKSGRVYTMSPRWRRLFAYVPQGNMLMTGTIRETVSLADPAAAHDNQRLQNALRVACASAFVQKLPNGADTRLGERGSGLSEGQMQRLAIARAVFSNCPILLLDEATSALDEKTELEVLNNLRRLHNRTVLIVTHRRSVVNVCGREVHFSERGVVER